VNGQTHAIRQEGAPPPSPPPDNGGEKVDLSGRAFFVDGSCPNLTFLVDFRRLRSGTRVTVDGRLQSDGRVRATKVEIDDDDDN
jgi:hypothetical protein